MPFLVADEVRAGGLDRPLEGLAGPVQTGRRPGNLSVDAAGMSRRRVGSCSAVQAASGSVAPDLGSASLAVAARDAWFGQDDRYWLVGPYELDASRSRRNAVTTVLPAPSAPVAMPGNKKWWALGALVLAVLAVGVDGTVLSVALPTLSKALHASESDLQWFSSGYFLVLAAAMLPAGLLGDRYGRKKVLVISLALFGAGSVACAYSTSVAEFMAARVLVGLAGAGLIVMALSASR